METPTKLELLAKRGLGQVERAPLQRLVAIVRRFAVQAALPVLSDGASVVIIGSVAGSKGLPGGTLYAGAKAAVRAFARVWTQELRERRIRTNVLSPGPVDTPAMQGAPDAFRQMVLKDVPMGRMASAAEIAEVALFLASDASSFVTGIELFADGGWAQV